MSLQTLHFINGEQIRPVNADEIGFVNDFTGDPMDFELTVDRLILSNRAKAIVLEYFDQYGITGDIPYTVQVGNLTIEYQIPITEDPLLSGRGDSEIEVNIIRKRSSKWFKEQADALSWGVINNFSAIPTLDHPYLIIKDNQLELLIMLGISTYTLTKALIEGVRELITLVTAPTVQASVPNAGVPPSMDLGDIIALVLKILAQVVYLIAIVLALIELTKQIVELLFPPIRNFKECKWKDLFIKGCAKLGFQFQSTLLDGLPGLGLVPVPLQDTNANYFEKLFSNDTGYYNKGYPTNKDSAINTFGKFIDVASLELNAEYRIIGNTVYFELEDFWEDQAGLQIISTLTLQDERENRFQLNTGEIWKRYYITRQVDSSDFHTMVNVKNLDVELSTEIVNPTPIDSSIKGLVEINSPFAYATRKNELTFVEETAKPFAKLADEVVQFFGGTSNLVAKIEGRIGVTQIGQQFFTVPKVVYTFGGRQPNNYLDIIGAPKLWDNYHSRNNVRDNTKRIYQTTVPFSLSNFEALQINNYAYDQNGILFEILNFKWINENREAELEYAIKSNDADNTTTIRIDE